MSGAVTTQTGAGVPPGDAGRDAEGKAGAAVSTDAGPTEARPRQAVPVPEAVRRRLAPFDARLDRHSWLAAGLVTLVAAILRLVKLERPRGKIFDETYYATEAQALLRYGVEWDLDNNVAKYVVHPPLGKWFIALGQGLFGYTELGWRISAAVVGIASVLMLARIGRRMFGSTVLGCAAALLMALDGMHFVLSRSALLDIFLMFLLLGAFGCLLIDRDARRRRWLAFMEAGGDPSRPGRAGRPPLSWPGGVPWWRLLAFVLAGAALGVKWSAAFFVPFFVLLIVVWEAGARRSAGVRRPWRDTVLDETGWVAAGIAAMLVTYLSTWTGWLLSDDGYGRHRIAAEGGTEPPVVGALTNLLRYHLDAFSFHSTLQAPHTYQSWPWHWLVLGRPVAFYWSDAGPCGAPTCAAEVLLLGTPVLWWSFLIALPLLGFFGVARRDWRAFAIGLGVVTALLPWFYYAGSNRTMFYFYALPAEPFLVLAVAYVLGAIMTPRPGAPPSLAATDRRTIGAVAAGGYLVLVALCFAYFYPIYTGQPIPYADWAARMWLNTWI